MSINYLRDTNRKTLTNKNILISAHGNSLRAMMIHLDLYKPKGYVVEKQILKVSK